MVGAARDEERTESGRTGTSGQIDSIACREGRVEVI
jgi:hypothetical protein